jgi:hypothetical protein
MIAELIVLVVILATAGFMYLKGSVLKSFLLFINALISSAVALAFFETAAKIIIGYGYGGQWVLGGSLIFIFIVIFAIMNALTDKLAPADGIHFTDLIDKIARSSIAIFTGLAIAGTLLITAALMPIGTSWPYQRFDPHNKNLQPQEPDKGLILDADGFTAGLASWFSRGSMCSSKSLAVFHPEFLNEIYSNRIGEDSSNLTIAGAEAVEVKAAWEPNSTTKLVYAAENKPLDAKSGTKIIIVRTGLKSSSVKDGGAMTEDRKLTFTTAQVKLICKTRDSDNLGGSGYIVWPVGFVRNETIVEGKNPGEEIKLLPADFSGGTKWYDFVFYIPADTKPVLLEFKLNAAAEVGKMRNGPPPQ